MSCIYSVRQSNRDTVCYLVLGLWCKLTFLTYRSYVSELLGNPKPKENLIDFLSASSLISLKLGRVDVRFHEPWSLKGFIEEQQARMTTLTKQIDAPTSQELNVRIRLLRTMGYKILSDINAVSVVMPTALIGTVLLTLRGRGESECLTLFEVLQSRAHLGNYSFYRSWQGRNGAPRRVA